MGGYQFIADLSLRRVPALSLPSSARCTDTEKQNEEGGRGEEIRFAAGGKGLGLCEKGLRRILQRLRGGFWRGGREMGRLPGRRWRVPRRQRASQIPRLRGQRQPSRRPQRRALGPPSLLASSDPPRHAEESSRRLLRPPSTSLSFYRERIYGDGDCLS